MKNMENNKVTLTGEIVSDFEFNHEVIGEGFYLFYLKTKRKSGVDDILPVIVSERLLNVKASAVGARVIVNGQFRSFNKNKDGENRLILTVFARDIENLSEKNKARDVNEICLKGYICKHPVYRVTPLKREITDILLAVNRPYGKSDYMPCICWERNARYIGTLEVGTKLEITGRIQSREYIKKFPKAESEHKVAYEVSVSKVDVIEETEEQEDEIRD